MQVADARMVVQNLVMGLKTLLYSIANYGNTAGQRLSAPTGAPQHTVGLREEEVRQAARALAAGIPCLQLFKGAERVPERPVDIYDSFADIFTVLQVGKLRSYVSGVGDYVCGIVVQAGREGADLQANLGRIMQCLQSSCRV